MIMKRAMQALATKKYHLVHGRHVLFHKSTQSELYEALFPSWSGSVNAQGECVPDTNDVTCPFVAQAHILTLLNVCKGIPQMRKCRFETPFENVISILTKIPWQSANMIAVTQRDHLFELAKCMVSLR